jgi:DNA polymerase
MTIEEKTALAKALDLADDYLRDGYACDRGEYVFAEDPPESAASSRQAADSLDALKVDIRNCTACPLHAAGAVAGEKAVAGEGAGGPLVLILGDAPGKEDVEAGRPFAGAAGDLLDRMLGAIALSRGTNCYLTNRVKCRSPERPAEGGTPPGPEALAACAPFLKRELALLKPLVILVFERTPGSGESAESPVLEPSILESAILESSIPCVATHHPASIQADGRLKRPAWEKLKALSSTLTGLDRDYAAALRTAGRS